MVYIINQIYSDDDSDGEGLDGDDLYGHLDIDANMVDNDNIGRDDYGFDNIDSSNNGSNGDDLDFGGDGRFRKYNDGGYEFNGGSDGSGDNFEVFDFHKGDNQPHAIIHVPPTDNEPRDAPPIQTFSIAEGLQQVPHGDTMVVANPTIDEVEPSQPMNDSLDFGDTGEGSNVHEECNSCNVEPPEQMNASSRITSPNVPLDMLTTPLSTNLLQSPGLCTLPPPNRSLTHNIAN